MKRKGRNCAERENPGHSALIQTVPQAAPVCKKPLPAQSFAPKAEKN